LKEGEEKERGDKPLLDALSYRKSGEFKERQSLSLNKFPFPLVRGRGYRG